MANIDDRSAGPLPSVSAIGAGEAATPEQITPEQIARRLLRQAWKAGLATVGREDGHPYGSLVAMACDSDGAPLLLLSTLAEHTRNLAADDRASLLVDGTSEGPDALAGPRITVVGRLQPNGSATSRARFLARHPGARHYIDFADFGLYRLAIERAHLVAGFGRIDRLEGRAVLLEVGDAAEVIAAEPGVLEHMNADHADAIALMAERLGGGPAGGWRITGCDPCGIDLASGRHAFRLEFPHRVVTSSEVRTALIALVAKARAVAL